MEVAGNREHSGRMVRSSGAFWEYFRVPSPINYLGICETSHGRDEPFPTCTWLCKNNYYYLQQCPAQSSLHKQSPNKGQSIEITRQGRLNLVCLPGMFPELELHGSKASNQSSGLFLKKREISQALQTCPFYAQGLVGARVCQEPTINQEGYEWEDK